MDNVTQASLQKPYWQNPPKIPGTIFKAPAKPSQVGLAILIVIGSFVGYMLYSMLHEWWLVPLFGFFFALLNFIPSNGPQKVELTPTTVIITYSLGKSVSDALDNYVLCIRSIPKHPQTVKRSLIVDLVEKDQYVYSIYLLHDDYITRISKTGVASHPIIPLSSEFYYPENLKEYVEDLQSQLQTPLELMFIDDIAKHDYETGIYSGGKSDIDRLAEGLTKQVHKISGIY